MIIDSETHPIGLDNNGKVQDFTKSLLKYMDQHGIDAACVLPAPVMGTNIAGKFIEEAVKASPKRLIPWCRLFYEEPVLPNPWTLSSSWKEEIERALKEVKQMLESGIFKGLGEFEFPETGFEDPLECVKAYYPLMDIVAKFKVPVQFHTGTAKGPWMYFDPMLLDSLANRYPEIPFIIDHSGGMTPHFADICFALAEKYENILLQIANIRLMRENAGRKMYRKFIRKALAAYKVGADRLIFGSDWRAAELAGNTPSAIKDEGFASITIEILKEVEINERERELILGDNLKKLLKI